MAMSLITFIIILVALFILVEVSKHNILNITVKIIFLVVLVSAILFFITSQLELDEQLESDNKFIQTGAAVLKTIKDSEIADAFDIDLSGIKDKLKKDSEDF